MAPSERDHSSAPSAVGHPFVLEKIAELVNAYGLVLSQDEAQLRAALRDTLPGHRREIEETLAYRRSASSWEMSDSDHVETQTITRDAADPTPANPRRRWPLVAGALVLTLVAGGVGTVLAVNNDRDQPAGPTTESTASQSQDPTPSTEPSPTTPPIAAQTRSEVIAAAITAVEASQEFHFSTVAEDWRAAVPLMTQEEAKEEAPTERFFARTRRDRAGAQIAIRGASITRIDEDSADLLVLYDSTYTFEGFLPTKGQDRVWVSMVTADPAESTPTTWLLDELFPVDLGDGPGLDFVDPDPERVSAMEAATNFAEVWNTYDPRSAGQYVARVPPLLTLSFAADFKQSAPDRIRAILAKRLTSTGKVLQVGVATQRGDRSTVLVAADARQTVNGQKTVEQLRWKVSLVRQDGRWLVDGFKGI